MQDRAESEARRLTDLLALMVRVSGRSRRSLEEELELGGPGLSQVLDGTVQLQVHHILSILAAIQVDPYEFLDMVYPGGRIQKSPLMKEIRDLLEKRPPRAPMKPREPYDQDDDPVRVDIGDDELPGFDERVRLLLRRLRDNGPQTTN